MCAQEWYIIIIIICEATVSCAERDKEEDGRWEERGEGEDTT